MISFEERIKENIRRYHSADLYDMQVIEWQLRRLCSQYGLEMLLTDRHGEHAAAFGDFEEFTPDVVKKPGMQVRICNHTIGHLYVREAGGSLCTEAEEACEMFIRMLEDWGQKAYLANELAEYRDELESQAEADRRQAGGDDRKDILTGTLCKKYFENRLQVIDRAEIAPVALIQANINDWKFFHDNFGIEESDRLIRVVGKMLLEYAKPDYVIGRCGGDLFNIVIPMPEEQEAEDYVRCLRNALATYDDPVLVPSVAFGIVYKENVEESLNDKISDAEYEMFNDKLRMKNAPDYRERLEKGIGSR